MLSKPKPIIEYKEIPIKVVCPQPPKVDTLILSPVEPLAVTSSTGKVLVGITPKHYENLSNNMVDILRALKQKNAVIQYYVVCIENQN